MTTKRQLETSVKRLNILADYLAKEVKPQKFYMGKWVSETYGELGDTPKPVLEALKEPSCGTAACAFGHAATIPEFRRSGLELVSYGSDYDVEYKGAEGFDAAVDFFHITEDQAACLFDPFNYPDKWGDSFGDVDKSKVVRRIRAMAKKQAKLLEAK